MHELLQFFSLVIEGGGLCSVGGRCTTMVRVRVRVAGPTPIVSQLEIQRFFDKSIRFYIYICICIECVWGRLRPKEYHTYTNSKQQTTYQLSY